MYILMISRGIPTPEDPQWGCFEQDHAEALAKIGHKVVVLSVDRRFLWRYRRFGCTKVIKNGVTYFNSFIMPGKVARFFGYKFANFVKYKQLDYLYKKSEALLGKPDIIYSHFFFNTALGVYLKNKYNIPLVGIEHAARFNSDILTTQTINDAKYAYNNTNAIITVCETLRERLKHHFNKDSYVVHNLVNPLFLKYPIIARRDKNCITFVSTGSLIYRKGFDLIIKAASQLQDRTNIKFIIIGEGEERSALEKLIVENDLTNIVELVGRKNKNQIIEILDSADAFILASRGENFSVAILEALARGLPVIATLCGGVKECITKENGILIPVDDVDSLSSAIKEMRNNIHRYDRTLISASCNKRFSPEAIASRLTEVFEQTINL